MHDQVRVQPALVQTCELTRYYGSLGALVNCGLQIDRGEVFGLLGPNGSGKSTLLRLLMGYLRPTSGSAQIDGLDCHSQSVAVHERVAYLPGDPRLAPRMRGSAVLRFFSQLRGEDVSRSHAVADRLNLDLTRSVGSMSTGMRQKLALAVVLAWRTPLLILDEPTANLDPTVRSEVLSMVCEARAQGRTVIFSSHVLDEVEEACDRVAILRQGRLAHVQVMSQLRCQHRVRARLTGSAPLAPPSAVEDLRIEQSGDRVTIITPGELSPWLAWLAGAPLTDVHIEPFGLRAVYDQYHGLSPSAGAANA